MQKIQVSITKHLRLSYRPNLKALRFNFNFKGTSLKINILTNPLEISFHNN